MTLEWISRTNATYASSQSKLKDIYFVDNMYHFISVVFLSKQFFKLIMRKASDKPQSMDVV